MNEPFGVLDVGYMVYGLLYYTHTEKLAHAAESEYTFPKIHSLLFLTFKEKCSDKDYFDMECGGGWI